MKLLIIKVRFEKLVHTSSKLSEDFIPKILIMTSIVPEAVQKESLVASAEKVKITDSEMNEVDKENVRKKEESENDQSLGKKRKCDEMSEPEVELGKSHVFVTRSIGKFEKLLESKQLWGFVNTS